MMDGVVTKEALMEDALKIVQLSSKRSYQIRRISVVEFASSLGNLMDVSQLMQGTVKTDVKKVHNVKDLQEMEALVNKVCVAGVVEPPLVLDSRDGVPVNYVPWGDRLELFQQILAHTGFGKEEGNAISPLSKTEA